MPRRSEPPNPGDGSPAVVDHDSAGARVRALWPALCQAALELLSPSRCSACDEPLPRPAVFCTSCANTVERAHPCLLRVGGRPLPAFAFALYGGAVADALRRFKYDDRPDLARPLGELVRAALRGTAVRADVVVPVPLHPTRLAERGYNQAALLAPAAARELDASSSARALRRIRPTCPQTRLRDAERRANVAAAFRVRRPAHVARRHIVVLDDVATTGATLRACAGALLEAGASSVTGVAVARAALHGHAGQPPGNAPQLLGSLGLSEGDLRDRLALHLEAGPRR